MQWSHIFHEFMSMTFSFFESQMSFWLHKQKLWHSVCGSVFFLFFCFFKCLVKWFLWIRLNIQRVFFSSIFRCLGTARNIFAIFSAFSSNECVLYLSYDLFCDGPISFCINFLLQLSFSKVSITSGLFSSKIKPCYNLSKCCSHSAIAMFVFLCICASWEINCVNKCQKLLFIGLSLCLIMSSNCSTFCIGNFYVVRNPFAIAFLYINIWIVYGVIFCFFPSKFICALMFFSHCWFKTTNFFEFF